MAKSEAELINMLRNVTGRVDDSDPLFTNAIMKGYLVDFAKLQSTQDIRIFKNYTWYEFTYGTADLNPLPIDLNVLVLSNGTIGASTIEPPAYCAGFNLFWYQSPMEFYRIWPETQTYAPSRPTYVLYYNRELTFRNPPDQTYDIKIAAYSEEIAFDSAGLMQDDYLYRYIVYGAALDIFADYGEMDKWNDLQAPYMKYRSKVYARTYQQYQNQRAAPEF